MLITMPKRVIIKEDNQEDRPSHIPIEHIVAVKGKYMSQKCRLTAQYLQGHLRINEILDEELKEEFNKRSISHEVKLLGLVKRMKAQ